MIIDIHNHPDWHGHNLDKYLANMDQCGIDKTVLLSWECPESEYDPGYIHAIPERSEYGGPIPFKRCISYAERAPDRFILGYCPDPRQPYAVQKLKAAVDIYGVKVCGEFKLRMMFDNWDALDLYRWCGENGLPVTIHLDYRFPQAHPHPRPDYWYGGDIQTFERAIKACPETIFLGHAPGFWAHISGDDQFNKVAYPTGKVMPGGELIRLLDTCPNLYCDLSAGSGCNALKRDPEFAVRFLTDYQDRILYGRDYFDNTHQEFINSLNLPKRVLDKVYSGNAIRLLKL